jgi:hypothetical protein
MNQAFTHLKAVCGSPHGNLPPRPVHVPVGGEDIVYRQQTRSCERQQADRTNAIKPPLAGARGYSEPPTGRCVPRNHSGIIQLVRRAFRVYVPIRRSFIPQEEYH